MANGNFTIELNELPEDYRELECNFNAMRESVGQLLAKVAQTAHSIRLSSNEIREASDDLATRNEEQASSINDITHDTTAGEQVSRDAISSITAISEASAQVNKFSDSIDSIAFQTNLLALNAGVEAARAGEAGKGFAVVASEVRALSQRAADTAHEIKVLSTQNSEQISSGTESVQSVSELLRSIAERIEVSNRMIQTNAALAEQTNAATRSLVEQADQLDKLVSQFKTESGGSTRHEVKARPQPAQQAPEAGDAAMQLAG